MTDKIIQELTDGEEKEVEDRASIMAIIFAILFWISMIKFINYLIGG